MDPISFTPKYVSIQSARKPQIGSCLSGVVILSIGGHRSKCYIKFTKDTENFIARQMPYGIGPENTAYLQVVQKPEGYEVFCRYLDNTKRVLLWRLEELPEWVKHDKGKDKKANRRSAYNTYTQKRASGRPCSGEEAGNTGRDARSYYNALQRKNKKSYNSH